MPLVQTSSRLVALLAYLHQQSCNSWIPTSSPQRPLEGTSSKILYHSLFRIHRTPFDILVSIHQSYHGADGSVVQSILPLHERQLSSSPYQASELRSRDQSSKPSRSQLQQEEDRRQEGYRVCTVIVHTVVALLLEVLRRKRKAAARQQYVTDSGRLLLRADPFAAQISRSSSFEVSIATGMVATSILF